MCIGWHNSATRAAAQQHVSHGLGRRLALYLVQTGACMCVCDRERERERAIEPVERNGMHGLSLCAEDSLKDADVV